ncbi:hypothetical protein AHAT_41540 [Agarivorans sp. Toyoura001]|uniref:hypothetical protein n=1 Tax=Agarivorans sp. Toyoura001 TaxID=2283141 RepID=UPI0010D9B542|nr:hypothetical protein [Agarivorans sp. Toyoura001]GDY28264.1 hypothetical protein AHAT_41540 [Agarivorans sp. Toyoura001]
MNKYLTSLFDAIAIDIEHLQREYLSGNELDYLDRTLKSEQDLGLDFYTSDHGDNLECLLHFLICHKDLIIKLMHGNAKRQMLIELYTSDVISGNYDCFHFKLSKFPQTYPPSNQVITLYRIGRDGECSENLGCSWAKSIDGLNTYCDASGLSKAMLKTRPIFVATIDDCQVLFQGKSCEDELVLQHDFILNSFSNANDELRNQIGR